MMKINPNFANVKEGYLFSTVAHKVSAYKEAHPELADKVIRLGIGDVTLPLPRVCVDAMKQASEEMGHAETFHGYGEEQGYAFLRDAIVNYYADKGVTLSNDEVFVSDGAKSDVGNIVDLFDKDNIVMVPDPVYPVYVDTNIMSGREVVYVNGTAENDFLPLPEEGMKADIIYLCSPNNPTGAVYTKEQLAKWIAFAKEQGAVILFDAAYEAFVQDKTLPTSIYEVEGAYDCCIEFSSLSKTAGFTGTRCGYTVVPKAILNGTLNKMWLRRQTTKFNGVSYIIQRGAEAVFTEEGYRQTRENIAYYLQNAKIICDTLDELKIPYVGGRQSPYIWLACPNGMSSWEFFDYLLENAQVVGTPGAGFGANGEGRFRLTAFGNTENVKEAMARIKALLGR